MIQRLKNILKKIPFSLLSILCILFSYFVSGTIGVLIILALLCIFCVLPFGVLFAILDIVIKKKKLMPIICLVLSIYPIAGTVLMFVEMIVNN